MSSLRIKKELKSETYFITLTISYWLDIFTNENYFDMIINCLKFYQKSLKIKLYAYVIMTNHIHVLVQAKDTIAFVQRFKSFTDKRVKELIKEDNREYLKIMLRDRVWRNKNWPVLIDSEKFFEQKIEYIHNNPVNKGYVSNPEDWIYSSARNYLKKDHSIIEVAIE